MGVHTPSRLRTLRMVLKQSALGRKPRRIPHSASRSSADVGTPARRHSNYAELSLCGMQHSSGGPMERDFHRHAGQKGVRDVNLGMDPYWDYRRMAGGHALAWRPATASSATWPSA